MIFYTADTHFGDQRIKELSKRPFTDVETMNAILVENWNNKIGPDDIVYIVGDFAVDDITAKRMIDILNGEKHLVVGNHDDILNQRTLSALASFDKIATIDDCGRSVCLCHYPLASFNNSIYGGYHAYGHIHNNPKDNAQNVMKLCLIRSTLAWM